MEADITHSYKTAKEAEAVAQAVSPDNMQVPRSLYIKTEVHGSVILTKIICKTRFGTFVSTIDDLLSAVSVAEKSLSAVKRH